MTADLIGDLVVQIAVLSVQNEELIKENDELKKPAETTKAE